jgi:histidinol phosphatase-like enzyme (inositol monophosphatase family)
MPSTPIAAEQINRRLATAVAIALEAGAETLKFFRRKDLQVERKEDNSPVTAADRASETLLRARIAESFPDDAILGEEFGETPGKSPFRWILDPIDGTKSFIHGTPLYTTLVAVTHTAAGQAEQPLLGVIHAPATGETVYAANGGGCWYRIGDSPPTRSQVSTVKTLSEALLLTTDVASFGEDRPSNALDVYLSLQAKARLARTWGDAYGYLLVATGQAEVMIDAELSLWDAAALKPVIEEAGGSFTDWQGRATVHTGDAVATNGLVIEEVLAQTRGR